MVSLSNRTSMALFSDPLDHYSHRVRIVMTEKGVTSEIIDMDSNNLTAEIMLILDKNSLRFNKYQFKNYIISGVEKKELNNLKNTAINNINKVGNMT